MATIRLTLIAIALLLGAIGATAEESITYEGGFTGTASSGTFAPLYLSAMRQGVLSAGNNALVDLGFHHDLDSARRFSYAYGVKGYAGFTSTTDYERFDAATGNWAPLPHHPSRAWLQELYGTVKYRCLFLTLGLQETHSPLLDEQLTGGDLIQSGNSRPLPGVRAGFIDFRDIPFTNGWVQIEGQLFYGRYTDSDWWESRFNYYTGHITTKQWMIYRRCYFRTKPEKPLSVTVGVQCATQFGGITRYWTKGVIDPLLCRDNTPRFKDFVKMLWPAENGDEGFYAGNTLGTWDLKARYRLRDNSELSFYFQWPWEDGSGMGKMNGLDGLWGVEYKLSRSRLVKKVVFEFLDLTNQSGPIHWDPDDFPGTNLSNHATGADDYYNNAFYNPYAAYGLSQGSPMVMPPLYNLDGYMQYVGNRTRAIHVAVEGQVGPHIDCRIKLGHRRAWGNGQIQLPEPIRATSFLLEGAYKCQKISGLSASLAIALDSGTMPKSTFGALLSLRYSGVITLGKK